MVRLPRNEKQTYRLNSKASNVTIRFDLGHDLDLKFSRSNMEFPISHNVSGKSGLIATKRKANISIELQASNVTNGFDLDHNLDLWILKFRHDLDLWSHTWPWPWIFMVKFWNNCISEWESRLTLHKGDGSTSFMTMTIWWPRSGVWIYQIVTRVTSVVGMPSTHLVGPDNSLVPVWHQTITYTSADFWWNLITHLLNPSSTLIETWNFLIFNIGNFLSELFKLKCGNFLPRSLH